jgi:TAG lipase/steryl ester hydrolase/phospholipase A2/LPA acyltransferase
MAADLLVSAPSIPSIGRLVSLLHPTPQRLDSKAAGLRRSKSSPQLRVSQEAVLYRTVKGVGDFWLSWTDGLTQEEREERRFREERRQILCLRMKNAATLEQWEAAAQELDKLEGNDEWKEDDSEPNGSYNPRLLAERLTQLDDARVSRDIRLMMHLIRTALSRDLAGTGDVDLYRHSYIGTKKLIERYVDSTLETIDTVVTQSTYDPSVEQRDLLEGMLYARQSFGRSALLLSGGATFGMAHVGVLKSLFDTKLLPRIISGASAGSIVSAVMCTRTDEEMPELMRQFPYGDLAVFEDQENRDGILGHLRRLLTEGSWSDIKHLTRVMRDLTGDLTFQEAYNRTRRILNICVSTASIYELPRLLNYVTAPNVMIWSAVAASCSVPLVFGASPLLVKDPSTGEHSPWNPTPQHWIDGSVDNDLPMTRLAEMFNVNHFIVSQVNPHVVPFLAKDDYLSPDGNNDRPRPGANPDEMNWANTLTTLAKEEALHRLQFLAEMGIFPNLVTKLRSVLSQRYSGDITILPEMSLHDLPSLMKNPTSDFMLRSCLAGERATWPKLSRIRDRCATELALDRAVHRLRARVVFSEKHQGLEQHHRSIGNLHLHGRTEGSALEAKGQHARPRRQSGGSLLLPANRRTLFDDAYGRVPPSNEPVSPQVPALKRANRSHVHVPHHKRQLTAPAIHSSLFSRSPVQSSSNRGLHAAPVSQVWIDSRLNKKMSGFFISVTPDEADTSELGPSSGVDGLDLGTDESELGWDDQPRTQSAKVGDET